MAWSPSLVSWCRWRNKGRMIDIWIEVRVDRHHDWPDWLVEMILPNVISLHPTSCIKIHTVALQISCKSKSLACPASFPEEYAMLGNLMSPSLSSYLVGCYENELG
jgi:hypothetical protein